MFDFQNHLDLYNFKPFKSNYTFCLIVLKAYEWTSYTTSNKNIRNLKHFGFTETQKAFIKMRESSRSRNKHLIAEWINENDCLLQI